MLLNAIEKLESGDSSQLAKVFCAFATGDPELICRGGYAIKIELQSYSMQKMIRLSEEFRQYSSLEWFIEWKNIDLENIKQWFASEEDYRYVLILGSFHPNGYFRERCCASLTTYADSLPYFILRLNDWVPDIRHKVAGWVADRIRRCPVEEILISTQALDKVHMSLRREEEYFNDADKGMKVRIEKDISKVSLYSIIKYDFGIRKSIYKLLFGSKILNFEKAHKLLDMEKHSYCNILIINGILNHYECSDEMIEVFLHHKFASVRRKVLYYKYALFQDSWEGLEELLLDSNRSVRELAAFILRKEKQFPIAQYYRTHLEDDNPVSAIIGIGEQRVESAVNRLLLFLQHPCATVVKETILALAKLEKFDGSRLFWDYLQDKRVGVAKAGFLAAQSRQICYGAETIYSAYQNTDIPHIKCYLVKLLFLERSWIRLPYLLELYGEEILSGFQEVILAKIANRNMFETISSEQGDKIKEAVNQYRDKLPVSLTSNILFELKFVIKTSGGVTHA